MSNQSLPAYTLQELANGLMSVVDASKDQMLAWLKIMKLLLNGRPLSPREIAAALQISADEVGSLVRGAEFDQAGNVVGLGLSLVPTPHSYQIEGRQFYTWCAADAIMFPIFLKTGGIIESPDPISGEKIRLIATPEGTEQLEPGTAVVSWAFVTQTGTLENVRAWGCNFTNFFTSVETASQYASKHPGMLIVPVDEVFQAGRLAWDREPYKSVIADL